MFTKLRTNFRYITIGATMVGASVVYTAPANASTESHANYVINAVQTATPGDAPGAATPLTIATGEDVYSATGQETELEIPADASAAAVTLNDAEGPALTVGLPDVEVSGAVLNSEDTGLVFPADGDSVDLAVQGFDEGAQLTTVINSSAGAQEFDYPITVPGGGQVQALDNGGIVVLDSSATPVGFIDTPWATDAAGASVPTHFTVRKSVV